jgi:YHS domain-containing protein
VLRYILIAILLLLIARAFWRLVGGIIEAGGGVSSARRAKTPAMKLVRDPVCGTFVSPRDSLSLTAGGATHFFCSDACRDRFRKT